MGIEELCGRFKISTKIAVISAAFIMTIGAIGAFSYYSTGVLQRRLDATSEVVSALSGFKDVYASMTRFLQNTSEETRRDLTAELEDQKTVLQSAEATLSNEDGKAVIIAAAAENSKIELGLEQLWSIHQSEQSIRKRLDTGVDLIARLQLELASQQQALESSIRESEDGAKQMLQKAEYLGGTSRFFEKVSSDLQAADPAKIATLVKPRARFVEKQIAERSALLSPKLLASLRAISGQLTSMTSAASAATPAQVASEASEIAIAMKAEALDDMRGATKIFAELNDRSALAVAVVGSSRQLSYDLALLQSALARHLGQPTTAQETAVLLSLDKIDTDLEKFSAAASGLTFFDGLPASLKPSIGVVRAATSELRQVALDRVEAFNGAAATIERIWASLSTLVKDQRLIAETDRRLANTLSIVTVLAGIAIAAFAAWLLIFTLKTPIERVTRSMLSLAKGQEPEIGKDEARFDEIGDIARALRIFRDNAQEKRRVEAENASQRQEAEGERSRNEAERDLSKKQIEFAVSHLAAGLERLAKGDISTQIDAVFTGPLEKLRNDFNSSLARLNETLLEIKREAVQLEDSGRRLGSSSNQLAKRSEAQAASLEETAAAMAQIASIVQSTASRTENVNRTVGETKSAADNSSKVATDALDAMVRIEEASRQIEQIIGVIDQISFQTNLLALNAGVEAARAGESGKGFAVVAQEVRELAQRSGSAAEEVKGLISRAWIEVQTGSRMVQEMNDVLYAIGREIVTISGEVAEIAMASRTQSASVAEVNSSINYMDQITQENAAMVGQTSDLGQSVSEMAVSLRKLVERFNLNAEIAASRTSNVVSIAGATRY